MKVLVTGGAGFIGSHLVEDLISEDYEVSVIDNLSFGRKENIHPEASLHKEDIRDTKKTQDTLEEEKPDSIIHLAASISPERSADDPVTDADVNIRGTLSLYSAVKSYVENGGSLDKIMVASSQTTYGEGLHRCPECGKKFKPTFRSPKQLQERKFEHYCPECSHYHLKPIGTPEDFPQNPSMPYGVSKLTEEKYIFSLAQQLGIDGTALRYFNVYGPRQTSQGLEGGVTAIFFSKFLKLDENPLVYEDGKQTRDFLYVKDASQLTIDALKKSEGIEAYNGGCNPVDILTIAKKIRKFSDSDLEIEVTNRARKSIEGKERGTIDTRHCQADISKAKEELDWKPETGLDKGLKLMADWAKENAEIL